MLICFSSFALERREELNKTVSAVADCFTAALVSSYSPLKVSVPSTVVSIDMETKLPQRVAFFLADPADYVSTVNSAVNLTSQGFFSNITGLLSKTTSDPLLSAVFFSMSLKDYKPSDYLISGFIAVSYPEGFSIDSVKKALREKDISSQSLGLTISLTVFGNSLSESVSIDGTFTINSDSNGLITIIPSGTYVINGTEYSGGILTFQESSK